MYNKEVLNISKFLLEVIPYHAGIVTQAGLALYVIPANPPSANWWRRRGSFRGVSLRATPESIVFVSIFQSYLSTIYSLLTTLYYVILILCPLILRLGFFRGK